MSTNMNFGPEWMRGNLPKRSNVLDSSRSNSPTTPLGNGPTKLASSQHPTIQRQHSILDGLTVLDQNSVLTPQAATSGYTQDDQQDNPFKYSKEYMLSLYKPYALPVEIEKHDYVIVEECQQPLAKVELTESEKKLLSGPVHSNVSRKRADNASEQSTDGRPLRNKGEFVNNPAIEKDANSSRFGLNRTRGRQTDSNSPASTAEEPRDDASILKANPQPLGQPSSQTDDRNRGRGDQRGWNALGTAQDPAFDESSVLGVLDDTRLPSSDLSANLSTPHYGHSKFEDPLSNVFDSPSSGFKDTSQLSDRFNSLGLGNPSSFNGGIGADLGSKIESPRAFGSPTPLSDLRKAPEEYQWYYRDPTGLVQGPFGAQDMHDWFKAGFFTQTLLVRREDEISFEPLAALVRKIGDDNRPFLTPYNPHTPSTSRSALDLGMQQQSRMDDPFSRSPFGIPEPFDLTADQVSNAGQMPSAPGIELQMKKPSGFNGWGSNPGTPLFSNAAWDPIVSTPTKNLVDDSFERRSAVQSPAISPPRQSKSIESLKMMDSDSRDDDILSAHDDLQPDMSIVDNIESMTSEAIEQPPQETSMAEVSTPIHKLPSVITAPVVKPVSLREIQEEELRKQKESAKLQPAKPVAKTSGWVSPTPWSLGDDTPKGPSLREIQEMEAREMEARKAVEKQTSAAHFSPSSTLAAPTTMSWGVVSPGRNAAPPAAPTASNAAPWASTNAPKKTLREIQLEEEEEARKRSAKLGQQQAASLAAAAAAAASSPNAFHSSAANGPSKGYAGIVGHTSTKPASPSSWTTVASNRSATKSPTVSSSTASRSAWDSAKPPQAKVSSVPAGSTNVIKSDSSERKGPSEEFFRWCRQALKGLDSNVDCEDFMQMLVAFPLDNSSIEIIQDMIYANSTSLDGRRFADEFMKRRKADLAGKLTVSAVLPSDEDANAFKVVSKKKKFVKA
ncbi:hypothetical protein K450DRAFT_226576 [Umbelopsis ramanniana AG]|uniref:GYF domain-containing protein n=1 Tax=Umbelopsis ramanniana AG TaxID=1314678 RepID=A0AAD5EI35_UMBRA|nr:uncharacterized protein K450DRAFT_226576 [Umbelopsis ramanniana AG]KAI8582715.1 hypothetical protein K450DRAFT_226576 [Umbelopsis ramanniana AG]